MNYPYEFAVFKERNRNRVYDKVIEALERAARENGVTQSKIAAAMGRKPSQVSAWLSGPSNWTLDTVSDLLRAVGAEMDYSIVFDADRATAAAQKAAVQPPVPMQNVASLKASGTPNNEVLFIFIQPSRPIAGGDTGTSPRGIIFDGGKND